MPFSRDRVFFILHSVRFDLPTFLEGIACELLRAAALGSSSSDAPIGFWPRSDNGLVSCIGKAFSLALLFERVGILLLLFLPHLFGRIHQ